MLADSDMAGGAGGAPETIRPARCEDLSQIVRLLADDPLGAGREGWADPLPEPYRRAWDAIVRMSM